MNGKQRLSLYALPLLITERRGIRPKKGDLEGNCVFCGIHNEEGFPVKLPKTFMSYQFLQVGSIICPYCKHMLETPEYRRKSWLVGSEFKFLERKEVLGFILDPPEPPFAFYVTRTGKKHGWIPMILKGVNYSKQHFFVGFDESLVLIEHGFFVELVSKLEELREKGVTKAELLTASPRMKTLQKTEWEDWLALRKLRGGDAYELAVFLI